MELAKAAFACPKACGLNATIHRRGVVRVFRRLRKVVAAVPRFGRGWGAHRLAGRVRKAAEVDVADPGEGDGSLRLAPHTGKALCAVLASECSVGSWLQRDERPVFGGEWATVEARHAGGWRRRQLPR